MLVPPENFGLVEPGIYRCSKLESDNFPFLETLKLKSIIVLDAEKPTRLLNNFIQPNSIEVFNLGEMKVSNHNNGGFAARTSENNNVENEESDNDDTTSATSVGSGKLENAGNSIDVINLHAKKKKSEEWMLIEGNIVASAFELLLNKSKHNTLLIDSTSTLVGILRKIQKWNFSSILNEYRIYSGSSTKSNYYAENFLELVQIELAPFELDHLSHQIKVIERQEEEGERSILEESPSLGKMTPKVSRNGSFSDTASVNDAESIDDDDMDDDMLSASPQIPANLLKLVEEKKLEKCRDQANNSDSDISRGMSPNTGRAVPGNFYGNDTIFPTNRASFERRRSSIDSKYIIMNNRFKARSSSGSTSAIPTSKSFDSASLKKIRKDTQDLSRLTSEYEMAKEKYDYKYYRSLNKNPIKFENVDILKLKLPPSHKLPEWFTRGRDYWEETFKKSNFTYS
ncbi:uncharacterized protein PRCAT00002895001 [Priceomyces carsonii]|uniref:uncharacterized protein n=1 Tax=Priceomyces carsonii TaxID=28549 RepID=UPI002EDA2385|nr:unnamed protein product [Priceomyces carsonii]